MIINWHSADWLVLLWAVPLVSFLLIHAVRQQHRVAGLFAAPTMFRKLAPSASVVARVVKALLVCLALASLIIAVSRPRYGTYLADTTTSGLDVCVVLDVSQSMLVADAKPSRLDHAKSDILDLAEKLQGDRISLVIFAGAPVMKVPLTTNLAYFKSTLSQITPSDAPLGGSDLGSAVVKALETMQDRPDRQQTIVLISDGEHHGDFPADAAKLAAERGIRIISVGIGDPDDGGRIPIETSEGQRRWLEHYGQEVVSTLEESTLQRLASETSGAYVPARTSVYDLGEIYETHLAGPERVITDVQKRRRYRERFQIFAALSLGLLVIEALVSALRPRDSKGAIST